ncbi:MULTISPECIES: hypothetical protein [unclassified Tolypothrix]|uniref:hypothetical protein n=1 Tax=unclassified Tolypothrix TaxID=2649714 RepID=UPI0005EAB020|nr:MULTISPECIES: hypothetical protein [unclassified Tolypothrix]BAY89106.1 hypothetical protein NIES3275_11090 [Microchaete diplosiphon NIES-3275]EKF06046.1 hypothetical protein FDUTEX481_00210 [Tolypothrix sp. PCC 7601]MBE9087484.1 hypothetical protein [Tolypothrix sp. LEGE 11397]UYD29727.1 hypothetical protein HGR01_17915 [Tolypothrix sp. PCC 7712]UYD34356.1 hypothetical protein HG267_00365 [Tolypothrix sp. PCC 7601]
MARQKRSSKVLERAVRRAASMNSIDPNLDVGNGLTLPGFRSLIERMQTQEYAYNTALSNLDGLYREMLQIEQELGDMTELILLGVATKFGKSSVEYGQAGGVPKNQRRRLTKSESSATNSQPTSLIASVNNNGNGKTPAAKN